MINSDYRYTVIYLDKDEIVVEPNCTYIYGYSPEERSHVVDTLIKKNADKANFIQLELVDEEKDIIEPKSLK